MRLLHTADWHLGARLRGVDRTADQLARVAEVFAHARERSVDLVVVAGDVIDEHRSGRLDGVVADLAELMRPEVERGLHVVFVAGNHDGEHLFLLLGGLQRLVGPGAERVLFCDRPGIQVIAARPGEAVNLLLLPYPTPDRYGLGAVGFADGVERRRRLGDAMRRELGQLADSLRGSPRPTIMAGHVLVGEFGGPTHELDPADDVPLDAADLPPVAYVALGHVHRARMLATPTVRYAGPLEPMDLADADEPASVVLVELDRYGVDGEPELLPLRPTRIVRLDAAAGQPLEEVAAGAGDLEGAIVALRLHAEPGQPTTAAQEEARRLFPRLCQPIELVADGEAGPAAGGHGDRRDVAGTVRGFLEGELAEDPERDELVALADRLLARRA